MKDATCEKEGRKVVKCKKYGDTIYEGPISAKGHDWDEGTETKSPTCTQKGTKTCKCKRNGCHATTQETVEPRGHDWDNGEVMIEATCTKGGYKTCKCKREGCAEDAKLNICMLNG